MTAIEDLAPWVSLLAATLSIGYVVVKEYRYRGGGAVTDDGERPDSGATLGAVLGTYQGTIVTAVTLFALAAVLQLTVDLAQYVPPAAVWISVAAIVFLTAFGEATGEV